MPDRPSVVVVLGMHRSGTSLCANVLHELGIDMAQDAAPSPANRRGHWERPRINDLNDAVFARFNRRWSDYAHMLSLPEGWQEDRQVRAIRADIVAWMRPYLKRPMRFGFKDPRTARLLPMWSRVYAELDVDPIYIFCVRHPAQVARSVAARDAIAREQSEYRWLIYNAEAIAGIGTAQVCIVPYEHWFTHPDLTLQRLARFVDAPNGKNAVHLARIALERVDDSLRHDDTAAETVAGRFSQRLHRAVLDCLPGHVFNEALLALCGSVGDFERMVQPMLIASDVLRASVADQNRVIEDLNGLIGRLRRENTGLREGAATSPWSAALP